MPEVLIPTRLKGELEKEVIMLANTGSDLVILTEEIANEIRPKLLKRKIELKVGGGGLVRGQACLIDVSVKDPESGEERGGEVEAVIVEGQEEPLMGISALEKLGIILDIKMGKFKLG